MTNLDNAFYYNGNYYVPKGEAAGLNGYLAASMVSGAIMSTLPLFSKPFKNQLKKEAFNNHLYRDAFEKALKVSGLDKHGVRIVPVQLTDGVGILPDIMAGKNACYIPATRQIHINTNKISIAGFHEAGHAVNDIVGKTGKVLSKLRWPGRSFAGLMGTVALFGRRKPKDAPRDSFDVVKDNCGKLAFLAMLPTVFEEGLASHNGIKIAKKTGLSKPLVDNMKKLYKKTLLTYIGHAVLTGLAVGAASMVMDKFTRPKKIEPERFLFF